ncbi:putative aryl-alcohol dehydrogenase [Poronia punctata]|nr:putative aryl-alcohol dehydrogenase [Poronia punctata]
MLDRNMMDDVLISNMPESLLRSTLRCMVAQGEDAQRLFVEHVRDSLRRLDLPYRPNPSLLRFSVKDGPLPAEFADYVARTRCLISCKLMIPAMQYLEILVGKLVSQEVKWAVGSPLHSALTELACDVVQAMQALKECELTLRKEDIVPLMDELDRCNVYCEQNGLDSPFRRSQRQVLDTMHLLLPHEHHIPTKYLDQSPTLDIASPNQDGIEYFSLGPFRVPRLFNGFWQLSSPAWGAGSADAQDLSLAQLVQAGFTASDMADHYGDAELVYGQFRNRLPQQIKEQVFAATKWCVFRRIGRPVTNEWVLDAVKERCRRLGGRVELLQFHWYNYNAKEYLDILVELVSITKTHPELVGAIGLCNFDSDHVQEACEYLIKKTGAVGLVSNQVQFSVIDSRPLVRMCGVCERYGLMLLTYGSLCGGFLSSQWQVECEPMMYGRLTPSQRKYLNMIQTWDDWNHFQDLLETLSTIAAKYKVTLSNVATRWVLQQPQVGAVIVGTRLGLTTHEKDNLAVFKFKLTAEDMDDIETAALWYRKEEMIYRLYDKLGDCGGEYRKVRVPAMQEEEELSE